MKNMKDNKLLLKILSAVAAVILWFAVTYTEDPVITQHIYDVEIVFAGENVLTQNGLIVTNKDSLPTVSATISGNRSSVISALNSVYANVDVSGITEAGEVSIPIKYTYPTNNITLQRDKAKTILLNIEPLVSKEIPISIETKNADKNTGFVVDATPETEAVLVRGAESTVNSIAYAKAVVDAETITAGGHQEYEFEFYTDSGKKVSRDNILSVNLNTIGIMHNVYKKVSLPVRITLSAELSDKYDIIIRDLSFDNVLVGITDTASGTEVVGIITDSTQGEHTAEITLSAKNGIFIPEEYKKVTVSYELIPRTTKEIEIPIKIKNTPDGKTVSLSSTTIAVTVSGAESKITKENVTCQVDASGLSETEKDVPLSFWCADGLKIIGNYTIKAKIN